MRTVTKKRRSSVSRQLTPRALVNLELADLESKVLTRLRDTLDGSMNADTIGALDSLLLTLRSMRADRKFRVARD